jgi:aconitate hydratase
VVTDYLVQAGVMDDLEALGFNVVGMGVLPLNFMPGENADSLGLTGKEIYTIEGLGDGSSETVSVTATNDDGRVTAFQARVRIDTPKEAEYFRHGGILHYVLRQLAAS